MFHSSVQYLSKNCLKINYKKTGYLTIFKKIVGEVPKALFYNRTFCTSSAADKPLITQKDIDEFKSFFPTVVNEFTQDDKYSEVSQVKAYFGKLINYVVPSGHNYRGLTAVTAYKKFGKDQITEETIALANILGWIIEMNESAVLLIDDIVDNTKIRRGVPAWHTLDNNDLKCINDGIFLENASFSLLKTHFSKRSCYRPLLDLLHHANITSIIGQMIDGLASKSGKMNWDFFNMTTYRNLTVKKSGHIVSNLPVAAAMYLADVNDPELHKQSEMVLVKMGEYFQVQNDYTDCYENINVKGFIGNDIREGKFSWCAVCAFEKANPEQRRLMKENYGKSNDKSEIVIRNLYEELNLQGEFAKYKEESFERIKTEILNMSKELPQELYLQILDSLYKKSSY